jgi:hypothetical protein
MMAMVFMDRGGTAGVARALVRKKVIQMGEISCARGQRTKCILGLSVRMRAAPTPSRGSRSNTPGAGPRPDT